MVAAIDKAGRIVAPKWLREQLGFKPGQKQVCGVNGVLRIHSSRREELRCKSTTM